MYGCAAAPKSKDDRTAALLQQVFPLLITQAGPRHLRAMLRGIREGRGMSQS